MSHFWMTKQGKKINIKSLKDDHLRDILSMLRRRATAVREGYICLGHNAFSEFQDEISLFLMEDAIDNMQEQSVDEFLESQLPCWKHLIKEAQKRGME